MGVPAGTLPPIAQAALTVVLSADPVFHTATTVSFRLPLPSEVRLSPFDPSRRMVRLLTGASLSAGAHEVPLNANGLAAGVYFLRFSAAGRPAATRLVLLRRATGLSDTDAAGPDGLSGVRRASEERIHAGSGAPVRRVGLMTAQVANGSRRLSLRACPASSRPIASKATTPTCLRTNVTGCDFLRYLVLRAREALLAAVAGATARQQGKAAVRLSTGTEPLTVPGVIEKPVSTA